MSSHLQFSPFTGNVFRRSELPARKSVSPDMSSWLRGGDLDDNARGATMVTPYAQSAWVYTCVNILASSIAQIPFRISRVAGGKAKRVRMLRDSADPAHRAFVRRTLGETIIDSGPVVDLFNRPHPTMDRQLFFEMVVTWLSLRGEFFLLPLDVADQPVDLGDRSPRVQRMLTLTPDMFWHIVQGYELTAWRYTGTPLMSPIASEMLAPTEVVHSRLPNPYLFWRGMSPLSVASAPAQTDFAGEQFQKGLWLNNADTGVIVTTDQQATPEQQAQILAALRERKRKAGTPDRPLFLWGGAKIDKPTLSMMDMQYLETRKFLRQEIASIFKVPESMLGYTADLNDGGAGGSLDATKASFVESTLGSLAMRLEAAFAKIVITFGEDLVGWFDLESLPIMQAARRARIDTAAKAFGIGASFNDCNKLYDLGFPEYKGFGDRNYIPFNLQDASTPAEPLPSEDEPPKEDNGKSNSDPFTRMGALLASIRQQSEIGVQKAGVIELWKKHVSARRASVNLFKSKVSKVLNVYRGKALAKLDEIHLRKSEINKKTVTDIIFDAHAFGESLGVELTPALESLLQSAGEELMSEIGYEDPWKYPPKGVLEFLAARTQEIMGVGGTVRDQLNTSLMEGIEAGETHEDLVARVKAVFNKMTNYEAKRVAMTEVNIAYNTARQQAMKDAGIAYKTWLSSHGPHVRPAHAAAEEAYIDSPIPIQEPFVVMEEELMFPGDTSLGASLENIINCQCVQLAARKKREDAKSVTFEICGFGEMNFPKK